MPGWWRWIYGNLGIEYNSPNDVPREQDVKLKQVCMRQISLSKVKLNHVETKERIAPDLIKINPEFKIQYKNKTVIVNNDRAYITEIKRSDPIPMPVSPNNNNNDWFKSRSRIF